MMKIVVFTDLHMVAEDRTIIGIDPYTRLLNGIRHVNTYHADATCVIMTGDLADVGDRESYVRLKQLVAMLRPPCHLMVGNHDDRAVFQSAFPDAPRDANGFVQRSIDVGDCRLILLDTLLGPPYQYPESHAGFLCAQRLAWLDDRLETAAGRRVLIFMHHPPHPTGFAGMDAVRLRNGEAFYGLLARRGNVRHIIAGHVHRTISGSCRGIPFSVFKSPVRQQPMTFDSEDASLSVDEPAAYGIVLVTEHSVLVHTEDYELSQAHASLEQPRAGVGAGL